MADIEKTAEQSERNILNLLSTDLDVALTFTQIAGDPRADAEKQERNLQNAQKAYDSVLEWLKKLNTTPEEHPEIQDKLERLGKKLRSLGGNQSPE